MRLLVLLTLLLLPFTSQAMNPADVDMQAAVVEMSKRAESALDNYDPEKAVATGQVFSRMYFDVFEGGGMEFALGIYDKTMMQTIEMQFSKVMGLAMNGADKAILTTEWQKLHEVLSKVADKHQGKHGGGLEHVLAVSVDLIA